MRDTRASPTPAFSCAMTLTAHARADSRASSMLPSVAGPLNATLPPRTGIWPETKARPAAETSGTYEPADSGGGGSSMPISASLSSAPNGARRPIPLFSLAP